MKAVFPLVIVLGALAAWPLSASAAMTGVFGPYQMTREASGTSWQPDSTPHEGIHGTYGSWTTMTHGFATAIYDDQGGRRGKEKFFSTSMLMLMGHRPLGQGTFGLRGMVSLDPAMGKTGYPLLLQTGETADGKSGLIDRQHPHDLFIELATTYSQPFGAESSIFGYFGFVGEPSIGPPTFMHRFSGMDSPEAPITHHWIDSTHITYGVTTLGGVWRDLKLEASMFRGREPNQHRWDLEVPEFDSYSTRLSYNPTRDWALQVSYADFHSPEQLAPDEDLQRYTASASYNWTLAGAKAQTTAIIGQNKGHHASALNAIVLESGARLDAHTVFGRIENVDKNELFDSGPLVGQTFNVSKISLGYIYDFQRVARTSWGLGVSGGVHPMPRALRPAYGTAPFSMMVFARVKLQ